MTQRKNAAPRVRFSPNGLENIATGLRADLGPYWEVRVVAKNDDANAFDPRCHYVEARLFGICIRVCDDGEVYIHGVQISEPVNDDITLLGDLATWVMPETILVPFVREHVIKTLSVLNHTSEK